MQWFTFGLGMNECLSKVNKHLHMNSIYRRREHLRSRHYDAVQWVIRCEAQQQPNLKHTTWNCITPHRREITSRDCQAVVYPNRADCHTSHWAARSTRSIFTLKIAANWFLASNLEAKFYANAMTNIWSFIKNNLIRKRVRLYNPFAHI